MKKLLLLSLLAGVLITTTSNAQGSGPSEPQQPSKPQPAVQLPTEEQMATMLKEAKEKQSPMLVEKAGLTKAQADRVIEINYEIRAKAGSALAGLTDAERATKMAEFKALKEKKYSEIPLTGDQIKAVYAAYESLGKDMPKRN